MGNHQMFTSPLQFVFLPRQETVYEMTGNHHHNSQFLNGGDVTNAGPQLTSSIPKMWRHWRRTPTDLHALVQKLDVTDAGPQHTSSGRKTWRHWRGAPTDLLDVLIIQISSYLSQLLNDTLVPDANLPLIKTRWRRQTETSRFIL